MLCAHSVLAQKSFDETKQVASTQTIPPLYGQREPFFLSKWSIRLVWELKGLVRAPLSYSRNVLDTNNHHNH